MPEFTVKIVIKFSFDTEEPCQIKVLNKKNEELDFLFLKHQDKL